MTQWKCFFKKNWQVPDNQQEIIVQGEQPGQPGFVPGEISTYGRFKSPVEDFRVREVLRGIKLVGAQGKEANWPRNPVLIEALKKRPGELSKLRVKDVEERSGLVWIKIRMSKSDSFANGKFVPVEPTGRMSVAAISAVIKHMTHYEKLKGRFTAHSLRIGGVIAAMRGGMSLTQIMTIGG
ncbi:hypothetical protein C2G38_2237325 [Gigaspora rosea]|uniref:Uncharacterized protein n=1 Tax=Gigaspora rosea TaxID=44941 RepID=A0A397TQY3_9GLOM|nr:hypothetical protein C2G38_2237325 [Gigaspora rosea]